MKKNPVEPRPLSRRDFITTSVVSALSIAAGSKAAAAFDRDDSIDAHSHLWTPDTDRYPLMEGFAKADMRPPSFTPEELFAHTKPNGVTRIVAIQMSFYRFDNRYMLDSMRRFPGVFSGVGLVDENGPQPQDRMRELARGGVRGFRIRPPEPNAASWLTSPGMAAMWKAGADDGLAMCPLINPAAFPAVAKLCERFPRTRVVIDHCGRVGADGEIRESDLAALCALARFPLVHVKTSAFYALGKKQPPYTDLAPLIKRLRDAFGAERLMWASDCPYQVQKDHTYAASIGLIRNGLNFLSATDREWMLRRTAEKIFFSA
ncbi:MAG: hypothetical protein RIQ93_2263 [Verrucomicrobiota bacterium]|jgi:predicted TIM-barrel fold metal-dependent hydrolase